MTKEKHAEYMREYWKINPEQKIKRDIRNKKYNRSLFGRFTTARSKAIKRNLIWNLTQEEYYSLILNSSCHYCGGELPKVGSALDRKDNTKGYLLSNVVPCCHNCNTMKSSHLSYNEMILIWSLRKGDKNL